MTPEETVPADTRSLKRPHLAVYRPSLLALAGVVLLLALSSRRLSADCIPKDWYELRELQKTAPATFADGSVADNEDAQWPDRAALHRGVPDREILVIRRPPRGDIYGDVRLE